MKTSYVNTKFYISLNKVSSYRILEIVAGLFDRMQHAHLLDWWKSPKNDHHQEQPVCSNRI